MATVTKARSYVTHSSFAHSYKRRVFRDDETNALLNGDYEFSDGIYRFQNGLLHGVGDLPAIELSSGHCERWKHGLLHSDPDIPTVYNPLGKTDGEKYRENWWNGELVAYYDVEDATWRTLKDHKAFFRR